MCVLKEEYRHKLLKKGRIDRYIYSANGNKLIGSATAPGSRENGSEGTELSG